MGRLDKAKKNTDFWILILTVILVLFGVVMVFSASYYANINSPYAYLKKDAVFAVLGISAMLVCSRIKFTFFRRWSFAILILAFVLLVLVLFIGEVRNGAQRWINLKVFDLMPGEIAKPAAIFFAATFFSSRTKRANDWKYILSFFVVIGAMVYLIYRQPNLSTAITLFLAAAAVVFVAGIEWKKIGILSAAVVAFGTLYMKLNGEGYQLERITSFWNPFKDSEDSGYQVIQSLYALGSGGLFGKGLGNSIQKDLYIPEPHTDFILAVIGEELGFFGIAALMVVYLILIWRCIHISINAPNRFGMLLGSGITALLALQVIFNIAIVTASMPPTGVALPFISYGGNSLLIFCGLMGIMINISRYSER